MASTAFRELPDAPWGEETADEALPMDAGDGTDARRGTTAAGTTYYVRHNRKPKARAALSLVVGVGSAVEEEGERGVAHILEHLAFSATEKFSNHDLVKFLESIGAEFGACQNAYTSADETCYELMVPIDQDGLLEDGIKVLSEFAKNIRCATEDVEKERGAVLEEWRQGRDASGRIAEAHWKLVLEGTKYAERLPIGLEKVIRNVDANTVLEFYRKWYRPQNMAIIAVGDFDNVDQVIELIESNFDSFPKVSGTPLPVPPFGFVPHQEPRYKAFVDKETTTSRVYVNFSYPCMPLKSAKDFRELLKIELFEHVLNSRFFKISRGRNPPFYTASASTDRPVRSINNFVVAAACPEGQVLVALERLLMELARVRLSGISERELKLAKSKLLAEAESTFIEREQSHSEDVRDEYKRHFLHEEFVVAPEYEARLVKTLLKTIALEEVAELSRKFRVTDSCVVKSIEHRKTVDEQKLGSVVQQARILEEAGRIDAWEEEEIPESLVSPLPGPGSIATRKEHPELGVVELTLSNGMSVMLKQTDYLDDQVLVSGFAWGALSDVAQDDFRNASVGRDLALELGVFGVRPSVLSEIVADKRVDVGVGVGAYRRSFGGEQSPEDLEVAMQLIHLLFVTEVKPAEEELIAVKQLIRESIVSRLRDPVQIFSNRINELNYGCYYFRPITLEEFSSIDTRKACDYFSSFFKNPADFTIAMVGNVTEEAVMPLLESYLASIPGDDSSQRSMPENLTPLKFSFPQKSVREDMTLPMIEPCGVVQITFPCRVQKKLASLLGLMCKLIETRLTRLLRFTHGHVYNVSVSNFFGADLPVHRDDVVGDVAISFSCDPDLARTLPDMVLEELLRLQKVGVEADEVATVLEIEKRVREEMMQENSFWLDQVLYCCRSREYRNKDGLDAAHIRKEAERVAVLEACKADPCGEMSWALNTLLPKPPQSHCTILTLRPKDSMVARAYSIVQSAVSKLDWGRPRSEGSAYMAYWGSVAVGIAVASAAVSVWAYRRR
eukprot:scaffold261_cov336-Pavlova_lutheri.AAC.45